MDKDWQKGQTYVKAPKITKELGVVKMDTKLAVLLSKLLILMRLKQ